MSYRASLLLACGLLLPSQLHAQDSPFTLDHTPPPANPEATMLEKVTPAIVSVFPGHMAKTAEGENDESSPMDRYFHPDKKSDPDKPIINSMGSGVILSSAGLIITNHHVVTLESGSAADAIVVELTDRRRFPAKLIGSDRLTDLALLKIEATDLPFLPVADSGSLRVGDDVFAIGNPFRIGLTVTKGIVSALDRSGLNIGGSSSFEGFIQTDAPINPGNSGGALTDKLGRLVGINTAIYSGGGGGNLGIGFSVPSNLALAIAGRLLKDGEIKRGYFGAGSTSVDQDASTKAKLPVISGVVLTDVAKDGPAAKAGWVDGDVITAIDGKTIADRGAFRLVLSLCAPEQVARCQGYHDGQAVEHPVTLGAEAGASAAAFKSAALPGVSFTPVENGLRLDAVEEKSPANRKMKPGQIITTLNGDKVTIAQTLEGAIRRGVNTFKLLSEGSEITVTLRLE